MFTTPWEQEATLWQNLSRENVQRYSVVLVGNEYSAFIAKPSTSPVEVTVCVV